MTEETLFELAVDAASVERAALLDRECGHDPELRARVERLLAAHDTATAVVDRPPELAEIADSASAANDMSTQLHVPQGDRVDQLIGPYRLFQKLGEGGMGTVWAAEQLRPVKRRVALKLIKRGMDSQRIVARFEAERQALALMDHTSIAKVFDAGTTPDGRPYFAMELVKGVSITKYCDEVHASIEDRLALFAEVCSAVQHAHNKGIIHRDLKPSNILVTMQDGRPAPKIIDFGVAKALHQKLADGTMFTEIGQVIGTLEYMAPEQAELSALDIDTRADVYALGVLLYELLAGSTPITRERLRAAGLAEVVRIIKEEEPPRPSTRLSQSRESLANLAAVRRTDPRKLAAALTGELDWIVLKALEKDRTRRYETASAFKRDIERFLDHEPVEARPASAAYRLRKFYRRNRLATTAIAFVAASLVVATVGTTWGLIRAKDAEALAQRRFEDAETAREEAVTERNKAQYAAKAEKEARLVTEQQRKYAQAIADFVMEDFLALTTVEGQDKHGGESKIELNKDTTLRELLERAADKLTKRRDLDPRTEADLCWIIGESCYDVRDFSRAVEFLERCVELRRREFGDGDMGTMYAQSSLALAYQATGKIAEAIEIYERTRDIAEKQLAADDPARLKAVADVASAYFMDGRIAETISLCEQVRDALEMIEATDADATKQALFNLRLLARAYYAVGRGDDAIALSERIRKTAVEKLGADDNYTLGASGELAWARADAGMLKEAIELYEQVRDAQIKKFGSDHMDTLHTLAGLARVYILAGRHDEGIDLYRRVGDKYNKMLGVDNPIAMNVQRILASAYWKAQRFHEAISILEPLLARQAAALDSEHPDALQTTAYLGISYRDAGRVADALPLLERVYRIASEHPQLHWVAAELLIAYAKAERTAEARSLAKEMLPYIRATTPPSSPQLAGVLARIGRTLMQAKAHADAEPLLRECLAIREELVLQTNSGAMSPVSPWQIASAKSLLAGALVGTGESAGSDEQKTKLFAEAEPLLLAAWEGLESAAHLAQSDPADANALPLPARFNLADTLDRLIALYTALDRPSGVQRWQAAKAGLMSPPNASSAPDESTLPSEAESNSTPHEAEPATKQ
jgi:serine/threonine protein kinase